MVQWNTKPKSCISKDSNLHSDSGHDLNASGDVAILILILIHSDSDSDHECS